MLGKFAKKKHDRKILQNLDLRTRNFYRSHIKLSLYDMAVM